MNTWRGPWLITVWKQQTQMIFPFVFPLSCYYSPLHVGILRHQGMIIFPNIKQHKLQLIRPPFWFWFHLSIPYLGEKSISLYKSLPMPRFCLWYWRQQKAVSYAEKALSPHHLPLLTPQQTRTRRTHDYNFGNEDQGTRSHQGIILRVICCYHSYACFCLKGKKKAES